jgi:phage shock protein PspC (stress-responsive transcriptional regulator)
MPGRARGGILSGMASSSSSDIRYENSLDGARAWFAHHGLVRPSRNRMLTGVTAGIARRYGINVLVARIAMVAVAIVLTPAIYGLLWILIPSESQTVSP